eukprot:comp24335_c0_seq1/m.46096 comp24335_c0_seq1/g.46096  ORF comp24335_c0_seq1/g.46096 comp24335_c0_seq1/m.46096 type:complete len:440 (+) comp24335_c0_seq1:1419-2738(+)
MHLLLRLVHVDSGLVCFPAQIVQILIKLRKVCLLLRLRLRQHSLQLSLYSVIRRLVDPQFSFRLLQVPLSHPDLLFKPPQLGPESPLACLVIGQLIHQPCNLGLKVLGKAGWAVVGVEEERSFLGLVTLDVICSRGVAWARAHQLLGLLTSLRKHKLFEGGHIMQGVPGIDIVDLNQIVHCRVLCDRGLLCRHIIRVILELGNNNGWDVLSTVDLVKDISEHPLIVHVVAGICVETLADGCLDCNTPPAVLGRQAHVHTDGSHGHFPELATVPLDLSKNSRGFCSPHLHAVLLGSHCVVTVPLCLVDLPLQLPEILVLLSLLSLQPVQFHLLVAAVLLCLPQVPLNRLQLSPLCINLLLPLSLLSIQVSVRLLAQSFNAVQKELHLRVLAIHRRLAFHPLILYLLELIPPRALALHQLTQFLLLLLQLCFLLIKSNLFG